MVGARGAAVTGAGPAGYMSFAASVLRFITVVVVVAIRTPEEGAVEGLLEALWVSRCLEGCVRVLGEVPRRWAKPYFSPVRCTTVASVSCPRTVASICRSSNRVRDFFLRLPIWASRLSIYTRTVGPWRLFCFRYTKEFGHANGCSFSHAELANRELRRSLDSRQLVGSSLPFLLQMQSSLELSIVSRSIWLMSQYTRHAMYAHTTCVHIDLTS